MDIPAKAKFQGFGGPSAWFGCFYCTLRGERIRDHCYLVGPKSPLRNGRTLKVGEAGVRYLPALHGLQKDIQSFDCVNSMGIDVMHSVCFEVYSATYFSYSRCLWDC